ncbi:MAG: bifunctional diaminohydroxyphosphoribosylaminopyrimidine deaminase/5-amino-6-(5-phosphoribosylamino)uracil reductase RibD [Clostridia bacterium]
MNQEFMKRALELARKGWGKTNPNPLVGAVIVKDGDIVGEGAHEKLGSYHAEVNALHAAGDKAKDAEVYVTLEPCSHYGRTPPCAKTLIDAGVSKVIVAMKDPNPKVSGTGISMLKEAGIEVAIGVMEKEAKELNEIFIKYITQKLPFVIMKYAMTLDGKIAAYTGDSKWITGSNARSYVHEIRDRAAAIMVGVNTVKADNPYLTARIEGKKTSDPVRIIIDSKGTIPLDSNVLNMESEAHTIIATTELMPHAKEEQLIHKGAKVIRTTARGSRVGLRELMSQLYHLEIDSILLEGGGTLNASALEAGIVDKALVFIAPKIIGGSEAPGPIGGKGVEKMENAWEIYNANIRQFDQDILVEGYFRG